MASTISHNNGTSRLTHRTPSAVSLFSGCGGFCEGIELAGFEIRCAVEMDHFAVETYRHNFPKVPLFEGDVHGFLAPDPARHRMEYGLDGVDLVFGGPPCQGYSQIGTRDLRDSRNNLYEEFARTVSVLRPRVFLMENVPNLLLMQKGIYRDRMLRKFAQIGYSNVCVLRVVASDYGVPQHRHRVVFVGTRDEDRLPYDLAEFCGRVLDGLKVPRPFTVWDAIGDLPSRVVASGETMPYPTRVRYSGFQKAMRLDFDGSPYTIGAKRLRGIGDDPALLHNHHTKEIQDRRRRLIGHLRPGEKADSLPKRFWDGVRPEKWRRLHPNEPSYTILAHMHRDLSEWVHPKRERWITVREAARLQSFHDGFVFKSSEWQQLKQIGNAVPPLLAHALGRLAHAVIAQLGEGAGSAPRLVQTTLPLAPVNASAAARRG
jgi:DNA (cytosine-5)-methyltransferase 1